MTCIVGVVGKDGSILVGGDSAGVYGIDILVRADKKVFKKGRFIFGFCGSFREMQVINHAFRIPKPPTKPDKDHQYMVAKFVPKMRDALKKAGALKETRGVHEMESKAIVGFRGKLYIIEQDFQVGVCAQSYAAAGCGESYAMGALYAVFNGNPSDNLEDSRMIAEGALEAAVEFSGGVRPPFNYVELKEKE